jgi:hypothetical protein
MTILIDTNVLAAHAYPKDTNHGQATALMQNLKGQVRIVVVPVLSELFYFVTAKRGYTEAVKVFTSTCTAFQIEHLVQSDFATMQAIMTRYTDAKLDFTDVAIMAVAERLKITRIATFDRRDFALVRPRHAPHFELLP